MDNSLQKDDFIKEINGKPVLCSRDIKVGEKFFVDVSNYDDKKYDGVEFERTLGGQMFHPDYWIRGSREGINMLFGKKECYKVTQPKQIENGMESR